MPVKATTHAVEHSTFAVTAAFTDEDGDAVAPSSVTWRLEDDSGRIINSRSAVSVTPASSVTIVLTGADLDILDQSNESEIRRLIISAVYTSSLGAGLSLSESYEFRVLNTNALMKA